MSNTISDRIVEQHSNYGIPQAVWIGVQPNQDLAERREVPTTAHIFVTEFEAALWAAEYTWRHVVGPVSISGLPVLRGKAVPVQHVLEIVP